MSLHLLPMTILAMGVIFLVTMASLKESIEKQYVWYWHTAILNFAFMALLLSPTKMATPFLRGGLINDGLTFVLGGGILVSALLLQICRYKERNSISSHVSILTLALTFFCFMAVQSNRMFFSTLSIVAMILVGQGALLNESPVERQSDLAMSLVRKGFGYLIATTIFLSLCILAFGETQIDEIQIRMSRLTEGVPLIASIQGMILFGAMFVAGVPPVVGIFGKARQKSNWPMSLIFTLMFSIVAMQIILKQGIFMFSRVSVGATELEPQLGAQILTMVKWAAGVGLVLTPLLALLQTNMQQSLLFFILTPFLQMFLALSFGTREIMVIAMGNLPVAILGISLLTMTTKSLGFHAEMGLKDWVGVGRRQPAQAIMFVLALWSLAGFAPFYGGGMVQKILCINSPFTVFLAANIFLGGCYALRLCVFAFQRSYNESSKFEEPAAVEKIFSYGQVLALIFMGIFWQPLYKYGAYSIRHLFGDF